MEFQIGTIAYKNPKTETYTNEKPIYQTQGLNPSDEDIEKFDKLCKKFFTNIISGLMKHQCAENEPSNAQNGCMSNN